MWGFAVLSFTPMRFVVLCDAFSFVVLCGALWCSVAPANARHWHCGLAYTSGARYKLGAAHALLLHVYFS